MAEWSLCKKIWKIYVYRYRNCRKELEKKNGKK